MRGIHYVGELPEDVHERRPLVIDGLVEVIDLPVLRPEHERVAEFVGSCLGIVGVYLIAGIVLAVLWAARRIAWAVRLAVSKINDRRSV